MAVECRAVLRFLSDILWFAKRLVFRGAFLFPSGLGSGIRVSKHWKNKPLFFSITIEKMSNELTIEKAPENPDDLELVHRSQAGDFAAYEELIRRYHRRVYGLVYSMVSSREDAEDLVQEIFIKAWKALGHFREQSGFYTWIYRIALNRTINFRKRRNRSKTVTFDEFDPDIKTSESYREFSSKGSVLRKMSLGEFQDKMNKALLTLSEKHRAVVVMHDIQEMPHANIAKVMSCSEGTVRSRLFYAHKQLQAALAEFVK